MVIVKDLNSKINGQVLLFRRPLFQLNVFTWWESSLHPLWPHPGEFEVRKAAHQHRPRSAGVLRVFDLQKSPEQSTQFSWSHFFTRDQRKRLGRALRQTDQTVIFSLFLFLNQGTLFETTFAAFARYFRVNPILSNRKILNEKLSSSITLPLVLN